MLRFRCCCSEWAHYGLSESDARATRPPYLIPPHSILITRSTLLFGSYPRRRVACYFRARSLLRLSFFLSFFVFLMKPAAADCLDGPFSFAAPSPLRPPSGRRWKTRSEVNQLLRRTAIERVSSPVRDRQQRQRERERERKRKRGGHTRPTLAHNEA